jgi:PAS domain S-box-containing protein
MSQEDLRAQEDARLNAIRAVDLEEARPMFDRIAFLVQCFAGVPIAQVVIVEAKQVWMTGVTDTPLPPILREHAFASHAIAGDKVLWVEDATQDPRFRANPLVAGGLAVRFYAGAPIRLSDGTRIGAVSILDRKPRTFDAFLAARLEDFAVFVAEEWERRRALKDLKLAAAEASALSRRMASLIETAPVALVMTDRDLRILRVSRRWLVERGMEGADVVGKRLYDLFPDTHERRAAGYEAALQGQTIVWDRLRLMLPNGQRPWIRGEAAPWRDADGAIGGLLIKTHDITDMVEAVEAAERSEQRLRLATEMAELRVWEVDVAAGTLKSVGGTLDYLRGVARTGDAEKDLWQVVHPDDRPAAKALWRKHLADGTPFRATYRIIQPEGPPVWVASAAEAVWTDDGEIERIVGVLKNIDREKRAEQAMAEALKAAEAANRAKSEFLANMSHEIRTPLNGVMGVASVLGRSELTPAQREMVELIGVSAHTLEGLLSDVLDLARIEAGGLDLRNEPFDLGEALRRAAAPYEARAKDKGLAFKATISPAARGPVRGDAARLCQIVSNLLSNAVKFTDHGKVSLQVEAERSDTDVRMRLSVIDTGIGFDAEVGRRLFHAFEQADGSVTRPFGGAGLGLAISKALADVMGGVLRASSTPGEGAVFTLELVLPRAAESELQAAAKPAADPAPRARAEPAQPQAAPPAATASVAKAPLRVLLAEDHPTNRKVVGLILEAIGARITNVENGREAVEAVARDPFDLILMDMQMPVMDGLTAIGVIRERERREGLSRTPILALTANGMAADAQISEAAGADGHLTKPIAAEALIQAVQAVRRSPAARPRDLAAAGA